MEDWRKQYIVKYLIILLLGFILVFFIPEFYSDPIFLMIYGVLNMIVYLYLVYKELKCKPIYSLLNLYLIFIIISSGIVFFYYAYRMMSGYEVLFTNNYVTNYINKGCLIVNLENYCLITCYFVLDKYFHRQISINSKCTYKFKKVYSQVSIALIIYICIWIIRILLGDSINMISSKLSFITNSGCGAYLISLSMLSFRMYRNKRLSLLYAIITIIELYLALKSDSKLNMIFPLFPLFLYSLIYSRNKINFKNTVTAIFFLFIGIQFFNSFIYPLSIIRRNDYDLTFREYFHVYMNGTVSYYMNSEDVSGRNKFLERFSVLTPTAYCVNYADLYGHQKGIEIFVHSLKRAIPRVFYPDKPTLNTGNIASAFSYGTHYSSKNDYGTSTALGLGGSSYLAFGLLFVIFSSTLIGCLLYFSFRLIENSIYFNPISLWYYWDLVSSMSRFFEQITDAGFTMLLT